MMTVLEYITFNSKLIKSRGGGGDSHTWPDGDARRNF